jgi:ABC-type Fe3+-siderophore transport system permease subunit
MRILVRVRRSAKSPALIWLSRVTPASTSRPLSRLPAIIADMDEPKSFELITVRETHYLININWQIVALLALLMAICVALAVLFARRRKP